MPLLRNCRISETKTGSGRIDLQLNHVAWSKDFTTLALAASYAESLRIIDPGRAHFLSFRGMRRARFWEGRVDDGYDVRRLVAAGFNAEQATG